MDEKYIRVVGIGKVSLPPDTVVIEMILTNTNIEYEMAIQAAKESLHTLVGCLGEVGFDNDDIKTSDFRVNTKFENEKDSDGNFKKVFKGYEVINSLSIEFKEDPVLLSKVIMVLSQCQARPTFNIRYELKNNEKIEEKLLVDAVNNAKDNAATITVASRVKLGKIMNIEYDGNSATVFNNRVGYMAEAISLSPENIEKEARVTITWKIDN